LPTIKDYINLHPKQLECFRYIGKGKIIFFGGARGGGKSHLALASAVLAALQFPGLRILIMRRHYDELEQYFITKLTDQYPQEIFGYRYNKKNRVAEFGNRSRIVFRAAKVKRDAEKHLGLEYQFIIVDEANQFEEEVFTFMRGSLRNPKDTKFIPTLLMTGNPGGLSDPWFKSRFIQPDYKVWEKQEIEHKDKYVFIPSKVQDNPTLTRNGEYVSMLESLPEHYREAWLKGNWDVFQGQFFEEWNERAHIVEPFPIPEEWPKMAGMDIGGTKAHPTVLLKMAQNPDTMDVYVYEEYSDYGSIEKYIYNIKDILLDDKVDLIFADPSAFANNVKLRESDISPARMFAFEGIPLQKANNDRVNGWRVVKAWLHWTARTRPKLRIFDTCEGLIKTLPTLKYNPRAASGTEDLDTNMADDYADALRYGLMSGFEYPTKTLLTDRQVEKKLKEMGVYTGREILHRFVSTDNIPYSGKDSKIVDKDKDLTRGILWV